MDRTADRTTPKIFIAYTGGTIGMRQTAEGYVPEPGYLQEQMAALPPFQADNVPAYDIYPFDPLLDSANMTPRGWLRIAEVIRDHYTAYDGFLVVHGTDTMAFTASALSFMLRPLDKPVILTGSQLPLAETRNDAQGNLLTSLLLLGAYHERLAGVFLFFGDHLFRGNRTTKVNADAFAAFASPNFPPVAAVGINVDIDWDLVPAPDDPAAVPTVVELGGATVLHGTADLSLYATGRALRGAGVVSGYDMTTEAALAKLYFLFEQGAPPDDVRRLVQQNLRGELTPPEEVPPALGKTRRRLAGYR